MSKYKFNITPECVRSIIEKNSCREVVDGIGFEWDWGSEIIATWEDEKEYGLRHMKTFKVNDLLGCLGPLHYLAMGEEPDIWTKMSQSINEYFEDYNFEDADLPF